MIFNHEYFEELTGLVSHKKLNGFNGFYSGLPCFVSYPDRDGKIYVSFYVSARFTADTDEDKDKQIQRRIEQTNDINNSICTALTGNEFAGDIMSCVYSSFQVNAVIKLNCKSQMRPQRLKDIIDVIADMVKRLDLSACCSNCGEHVGGELILYKERSGYECPQCMSNTSRKYGKMRIDIISRPFGAVLGALLGCALMVIAYLIMWFAGYEGRYMAIVGVAASLGFYVKFGSGFTWKGGIAALVLCLVSYLAVCRFGYAFDMADMYRENIGEERSYINLLIAEENELLDEAASLSDTELRDIFECSREEFLEDSRLYLESMDYYVQNLEFYSHTYASFVDLHGSINYFKEDDEYYGSYIKNSLIGALLIVIYGAIYAGRHKQNRDVPQTKNFY